MTKQISRKGQRLFALLLAVAMMFSVMPMNAIAVTTTNSDGYIEVSTIEDLYNIRNDLTANYILMNDIDLTEATADGGDWNYGGRGWNPIGSGDIYGSSAFSGVFDGNGHSIIGMNIKASTWPSGTGSPRVGLFANVTGTVKNLNMVDANIDVTRSTSGYYIYVGAIAGTSSGTIENCHVEATIYGYTYGGSKSSNDYEPFVGGLIGSNSGTINKCSMKGSVVAECGIYFDAAYAGGICGKGGTISNSYNNATVEANNKSTSSSSNSTKYNGAYSGGISNNATVKNCYNTGDVSVSCRSSSANVIYASGICSGVGSSGNKVTNCYNIGKIQKTLNYGSTPSISKGYAIGDGTNTHAYYLTGTGSNSTGATVLTEKQALTQSLYASFDFENDWIMNAEAAYPYPQLRGNAQDLRVVTSVVLFSVPNKLEYNYKDSIDLTGGKLQVTVKDQGSEIIEITEDMITGFDSTTYGTQLITVTYFNKTVTFEVYVNRKVSIPIYTIADLFNIRDDLTANYILMNDIDLTDATAAGGDWDYNGCGWNPIGSNDTYRNLVYSGDFDGNGYSIIGMRIENPTSSNDSYVGLFAKVSGNISNLNMVNVSITGGDYAGAISATADSATFENCSVSGFINGTTEAAGGIVGEATNTVVKNSKNIANITGGAYVGGIIGKSNSTTIDKTFNTGSITAKYEIGYYHYESGADFIGYTQNYLNYAGGVIGKAENSTITNCYNAGKVSAKTNNDREGYNYTAYAYGIAYGAEATTCYNSGEAGTAIGSTATDCYYLDGSGASSTGATSLTNAQMKIGSMFKAFDFENVWILNEYANHPYPQLRSNIQDMSESASLVSIIKLPAKTNYMTGDKLDFTGAIVKVVYVSGREETIAITDEIVSGFDMSVAGEQEVTVTVAGASDTYTINVMDRPVVESITIISEPDTKVFAVGTVFDFTGAKALVSYVGGITETVDITVDMTTGGKINHVGRQTITYAFGGQSASFEVEVVGLELDKIVLSSLPNKIEYLEGQDLDLTGMVVTAVMNNGMENIVASGYSVSGYSSEPGTHTVTITYLKKTATFDVTVAERKIVSLVLNSLPEKTEYVSGQAFDERGMQVIATYDNGDVIVAENYTVSGFDDVPGIKNVVITVEDKSVSFPINVIARIVTSFELVSLPSKLNYIEYESFDKTGIKVEATYNDGITEEITNYEIMGVSTNVGTHTVSVAFEGFVRTFEITVSARVLDKIVVTAPNKTAYYIGESFDDTGLTVTACYNNGQRIQVDDYALSGFESTASGVKTITVSYGGLAYDFAVVVAERSVVETGGNVIVGNLVGRLGDTVVIPVNVTKNTGVAGFTHTINFDATALKLVSVDTVGGYADGTVILNDEKIANGEITILWFGSADVEGDGVVYNLTFEILETAKDGNAEITISFDDNDNGNISGENVIFGTMNGFVEVRSYWLGDLNGDRKYAMVDLLQLAQYVSGKEMTLTEKQKLSADVNEDGNIDIHDVIMLNQWLLVADM